MLSTREVATMLSLSIATVIRYCQSGLWKAVNVRKDAKKALWRIEEKEIERITGMKIVRINGVPHLVS